MRRYSTSCVAIALVLAAGVSDGTVLRGTLLGAEKKETESIKPALPAAWVNTFKWRSIGPANMSGRITSIAVYEKDPCIWWAATASGGLVKTTNNGVTFEHQFDRDRRPGDGLDPGCHFYRDPEPDSCRYD